MTSLGISPTTPSLLIPPNPSFVSPDNAPRGGILLNPRRESEPSPVSPSLRANRPTIITTTDSPDTTRRFSEPDSPKTPISPIDALPSSSSDVPQSSPGLNPPRIRFAPLPDPRRPRSLSTGRNIGWKASEGEDGTTTRTIEIRGVSGPVEYDEEDDEDPDNKESGDEYNENKRTNRRWSKTMTMGMGSMGMGVGSWKGTKKGTMKLLGMKEEKGEYSDGAPLKKSVSTGGFIGSAEQVRSPFRSAAETERKSSMQGPAPPSLSSRLEGAHRRNSSLEPATSSSLAASPQPVRMLNGRVYGSRRASEAAKREREVRERNEPAFVEWGHGKSGGGLGSNAAPPVAGSGRGFLGDAEEGSGMEWVKKRREERMRKAEEERLKAQSSQEGIVENRRDSAIGFAEPTSPGAGLSPSASSSSNDDYHGRGDGSVSPGTSNSTTLVTPATATTPLPPTPIIQVSEHQSPSLTKTLGSVQPSEHYTPAMQVPKRQDGRNIDVFDDESAVSDNEEDDDEDDSDEEDDGDFDDDEEEEEDVRTTSSAAGVEVVSRHKN